MTNYKRIEADASERIKELETKAAEVVSEVQALMERYKFDHTNAKLYDLSYELSVYSNKFEEMTDEQKQEAFEWFCESEWNYFKEYLTEKGLTVEFVGRTSSFYIVPENKGLHELIEPFYKNGWNYDVYDAIMAIDEYFIGSMTDDGIEQLQNGNFTDASDYFINGGYYDVYKGDYEAFLEEIDEYLDELEDTLDDIKHYLPELIELLDDVAEVYEEINRFKANQVEIFEEWYIEFYKTA